VKIYILEKKVEWFIGVNANKNSVAYAYARQGYC
jgi:hypothetical protein